jgi:phospholipase C
VKHNPAAYYMSEGDRAACQADDVPMGAAGGGAFIDDLSRGTLPAFSFVTPNLCNDTHDCSVATGDGWLADWMPRILASSAYRSGTTLVFVVWDEKTPMPFIVVAPSVRPGTVARNAVNHYALLRTSEEVLGITMFLGRAASAPSLRPALGI